VCIYVFVTNEVEMLKTETSDLRNLIVGADLREDVLGARLIHKGCEQGLEVVVRVNVDLEAANDHDLLDCPRLEVTWGHHLLDPSQDFLVENIGQLRNRVLRGSNAGSLVPEEELDLVHLPVASGGVDRWSFQQVLNGIVATDSSTARG